MKKIVIIIIALSLVRCEPIPPPNSTVHKQIFFDNYEYEDIVGNVELTPLENGQLNVLENPTIYLNQNHQLFLSFDLLTNQFENLSSQIYHCNKDWNKSRLQNMEFLTQINNFRITEFEYSLTTIQPYINYQMIVAKPKISGNYIIAVFKRGNPDNLLLTRKFLVVDSKATIDYMIRTSSTISERTKNHQIEFNINYENIPVNSPSQDISIVILQNHNWRTAIRDILPTSIRANDGYLEYQHLDLKTNFPAWNEFRFADLRTLNVTGRNVTKIFKEDTKISAQLHLDIERGNKTYSRNFQDINGDYIIQNYDQGENSSSPDYMTARFSLETDKIDGEVYVMGRFNNWQLTDDNRMRYDTEKGIYFTHYFLKQGYYEYMYHVENSSKPPYYFEGSYFPTENEYEILVYYRRPGNINDEIIGYKKFSSQ